MSTTSNPTEKAVKSEPEVKNGFQIPKWYFVYLKEHSNAIEYHETYMSFFLQGRQTSERTSS